MAEKIELAILAYGAYNQADRNEVLVDKWGTVEDLSRSNLSGFSAEVFTSGSEVVIAFRGTDQLIRDFGTGNIPAAKGLYSSQVMAAIELVADTLDRYPTANITFTGHSLGGGLASLMATFFNFPATVFDPAPFGETATDGDLINRYYLEYGLRQFVLGRDADTAFKFYNDVFSGDDSALQEQLYQQRADRVTGAYLEGEFLEPLRASISTINRDALIATPIGVTTMNDDADDLTNLNAFKLHSMSLLTAMMASPALQIASSKLPSLIESILDRSLYACSDKSETQTNFLNRLLRHQLDGGVINPNGAIDRFAAEVLKLSDTAGLIGENAALRDALIAIAIEYFNFVDLDQASNLFAVADGALHFKYGSDSAESFKALPRLGTAIRSMMTDEIDKLLAGRLMSRDSWHIQSGAGALDWTASGSDNDVVIGGGGADVIDSAAGDDFMVGNAGADELKAGAGHDTLIGGEGDDILEGDADNDTLSGGANDDELTGGSGKDVLYGGDGADRYFFVQGDGADVVSDGDGQGSLYYGGAVISVGKRIAENIWQSSDGQFTIERRAIPNLDGVYTVVLSSTSKTNIITIEHWRVGNLGLTLENTAIEPVEAEPTTRTFTGDQEIRDFDPETDGIQPHFDSWNNRITTGELMAVADELNGSADADLIVGGELGDVLKGRDGDDTLYAAGVIDINAAIINGALGEGTPDLLSLSGAGGNDLLAGGAGDDTVVGSSGADVLAGGTGDDLLIGRQGDDFLDGDAEMDARLATATAFDWVFTQTANNSNGYSFTLAGTATQFVTNPIGSGNDTIYAGGGNDAVMAGFGDDTVYGDDGDDRLVGDAGGDILIGGRGKDEITGDAGYIPHDPAGDGADYIDGGEGDDWLRAGGAADVVFGGADNDVIVGDDDDDYYGDDYLDGESGDDAITGGAGSDTLIGGAGNDQLFGERSDDALDKQGSDYLDGGTDNDILVGNGSRDTLIGGEGDDQLFGDASDTPEEAHGDDFMDAGAGNDILAGGGGIDTLLGGDGDDQLLGDSTGATESTQDDDYLDGGAGVDTLYGEGGADTLLGGDGDDEIYGDSADTPESVQGGDYMDGGAGDDLVNGAGGGDTIYGSDGDDTLHGDASNTPEGVLGDDYLDGGEGNDELNGSGGADTLVGGGGNDELFGDAGGTPLAAQDGDFLDGGDGVDLLMGGGGGDALYGGGGDDELYGDFGDTPEDGAADDYLDGGDGNDLVSGNVGNDIVAGGAGNDTLYGGRGDDYVEGGEGDDFLAAGDGNDVLSGGSGDDRYAYSLPNHWTEYGEFEQPNSIVIIDEDDGVTGAGNSLSFNFSYEDSGLFLGLGSLTLNFSKYPGLEIHLDGFDPDDPYGSMVVRNFIFQDRTLTYEEVLELGFDFQGTPNVDELAGTAADDRISALASDDTLIGKAGNDRLDGGEGADAMLGGVGNDTYIVDHAADSITEEAAAGTDRVESGVSFALHDNLEELVLTGEQAIDGVGNDLDNTLTGNDAANRLDGGTGADTMSGGLGDDAYVVDSYGDLVIELNEAGHDTVESSVSFLLDSHVEDLTLTGAQAIQGTGNERANVIVGNDAANALYGMDGGDSLTGNGGADYLGGGAGDDLMVGGGGNDSYQVGEAGDVVVELAGEGVDTVVSSIDYVLSEHLENLTLAGSTPVHGTGNASANVITAGFAGGVLRGLGGDDSLIGGDAGDVLDGGSGDDRMSGGAGNDTYIVDSSGDTVVETGVWDFNDRIEAGVSYALSATARIETFVLTGANAIDATGNAFTTVYQGNEANNVITDVAGGDRFFGNGGHDTLMAGAGDNYLDGGTGADTMHGGGGNDTYLVDNDSDAVVEQSNSGNDWVLSTVTHTLSDNVERLTLEGSANIDGTGNALDNGIIGNDGDNLLSGLEGHDSIIGNEGNDAIDGGAGDDSLYGGYGDDLLDGGQGNDSLDDSAGVNTLRGGAGDDIFYIGNSDPQVPSSSTIIELANEGTDRVHSIGSHTLAAHVEDLVLSNVFMADGTWMAAAGVGNDLNNRIEGNRGGNSLSGLNGDDSIDAGTGNDAVDGGEGDDTLYGGDDFQQMLGGEARLLDNADRLDGGNGNDSLDGGSGDDILLGGEGDDSIYGGDDGDGIDYSGGYGGGYGGPLTNNDRLEGGAGHDLLSGGTGHDILDGGTDIDEMRGGTGNDTYYVDGHYVDVADPDAVTDCGHPIEGATRRVWTADLVSELSGEGYDVVYSAASFTGGGEVEEIHLTGADHLGIHADGANAQLLYGNSGNNELDGGVGADSMSGGAGDDSYWVDTLDDTIVELQGEGNDRVLSSLDYSLADNVAQVENLRLIGAAVHAVGNAGDNVLTGNAQGNVIEGLAGDDTLDGGAGNDTLRGGAGNDVYEFCRGSGGDVVLDTEGANRVRLLGGLTAAEVTLIADGSDIVLTLQGGHDTLRLQGWNDIAALRNGSIELCDGTLLNPAANHAPVAQNDAGAVDEDGVLLASGNALLNDSDEDSGTVLTVTTTGAFAGLYGSLTLAANGAYSYTLNNGAYAVQSLGQGETIAETFAYTVQNNAGTPMTASASIVIQVAGRNDAPTLATPIADQTSAENQAFSLALADGTFADIDRNDALTYAASGADGSALPAWLSFNASTQTFTGAPMAGAAGNYQLRVTATDRFGATASDAFQLTVNGGSGQTICGTSGSETLNGAEFNDDISGGGGKDWLKGNGGDDTLRFHADACWPDGATSQSGLCIGGLNRSYDVFDGGNGTDTLVGTSSGDAILLHDNSSSRPSGSSGARLVGIEVINAGGGNDIVDLSSSSYAYGDVTLDGGYGNDSLIGNAGNDTLLGGAGTDVLSGGAGQDKLDGGAGGDTLRGGLGNDTYYVDSTSDVTTESSGQGIDTISASITRTLSANIELLFLTGTSAINGTGNTLGNLLRGNGATNVLNGGDGHDVLEGGAGNDTLSDTSGKGLFNGGAGADTMTGGNSNDLLIGGAGNDIINTGSGADIIVFNKGDGQDTVAASTTKDNTLSVGGAAYADLLFQKSGNDLILQVGSSDRITFANYYASSSNRSVNTLQVVLEGTADYVPGSTDAIRNNKIETFDFGGLVAAFDAARAADPSLTTWALSNALLSKYLSGSDTAALGGDLAYRYGRYGSLADISFTPALGILGASGFGATAQTLQVLTNLQDATTRLS